MSMASGSSGLAPVAVPVSITGTLTLTTGHLALTFCAHSRTLFQLARQFCQSFVEHFIAVVYFPPLFLSSASLPPLPGLL